MIREDLAGVEPYRWQEGWEQRIPPGTPVIRLDQNTQPRAPAMDQHAVLAADIPRDGPAWRP